MSVEHDEAAAAVIHLRLGGPGHTVRDALRSVLGDPTLDLVYPRVGTGGWIDGLGAPAAAPGPGAGDARAFTPILRDGRPCAGLLHDPSLLRDAGRLQDAVDAASLALDNERDKAALRAEVREVHASRARLVDAGDRQLQGVERNLHDGAQQRLVGLALALRLASRSAAGDAAVTSLLADAARELDDVRSPSSASSPAACTPPSSTTPGSQVPSRPWPSDPASRSSCASSFPDPLPEPVQVAAYYVVAEALANANKHAGGTGAGVGAAVVDGELVVTVTDDGTGGARPAPGSGLEGLADRVSSLGGALAVDSPSGGGTTVTARLPLDRVAVSDVERRRLAALQWIGWENWQAPGELYDQITAEDNLISAKGGLLCAGGNARVTERERQWLLGYHAAAHTPDWVIEAIASFDDRETLADLMLVPGFASIARGELYTALRMCVVDGPLTADEVDRVRQAADTLGIDRAIVDELRDVVTAEQQLRERRYELIVAPVLPGFTGQRDQ